MIKEVKSVIMHETRELAGRELSSDEHRWAAKIILDTIDKYRARLSEDEVEEILDWVEEKFDICL